MCFKHILCFLAEIPGQSSIFSPLTFLGREVALQPKLFCLLNVSQLLRSCAQCLYLDFPILIDFNLRAVGMITADVVSPATTSLLSHALG
jgi:hypothetical protein